MNNFPPSPPTRRNKRPWRFFRNPFNTEISLGVFATVGVSLLVAFVGVSTLPLINIISSSPSTTVWTIIGVILAGTFVSGALLARAAIRRTERLIRSVEYSERRLAEVRRELAVVETAIGERVTDYAALGERLREANTILEITDRQALAIRKTLTDATRRSKRSWIIWLLNFLLGGATGYLVNWTSNDFKPPFFH